MRRGMVIVAGRRVLQLEDFLLAMFERNAFSDHMRDSDVVSFADLLMMALLFRVTLLAVVMGVVLIERLADPSRDLLADFLIVAVLNFLVFILGVLLDFVLSLADFLDDLVADLLDRDLLSVLLMMDVVQRQGHRRDEAEGGKDDQELHGCCCCCCCWCLWWFWRCL